MQYAFRIRMRGASDAGGRQEGPSYVFVRFFRGANTVCWLSNDLQMLQVLRGTELGARYEREPFPLLSLEEYADLIAESAAILPEDTVFHRMTGDGPGPLLLAPDWTRNKKRVLNTINARLKDS